LVLVYSRSEIRGEIIIIVWAQVESENQNGIYYIANITRSSAIAEGPRDASCQLKSCQLPRNSAETTDTTSPDQIDGMKLDIVGGNA